MVEKPVVVTRAELDRLLERAAEQGAKKALRAVGLHDEDAENDVRDLRGLLDAWRVTKATAMKTAVKVATTLLLGAITVGLGLAAYKRD